MFIMKKSLKIIILFTLVSCSPKWNYQSKNPSLKDDNPPHIELVSTTCSRISLSRERERVHVLAMDHRLG